MNLLIQLAGVALGVYLGAKFMPGVMVKNFKAAIWVSILLAIVNVTIGWFLKLITFPLNWLTLGIVYFLISVLMLMLVDKLIAHFKIKNFWWAVLLALFISFVTGVLDFIF